MRRAKRPSGNDTQAILRHWREAVPNDRLAHLVKDATRALLRALQMRLAAHSVSLGHWTFLRILWEKDGLTQKELSEHGRRDGADDILGAESHGALRHDHPPPAAGQPQEGLHPSHAERPAAQEQARAAGRGGQRGRGPQRERRRISRSRGRRFCPSSKISRATRSTPPPRSAASPRRANGPSAARRSRKESARGHASGRSNSPMSIRASTAAPALLGQSEDEMVCGSAAPLHWQNLRTASCMRNRTACCVGRDRIAEAKTLGIAEVARKTTSSAT